MFGSKRERKERMERGERRKWQDKGKERTAATVTNGNIMCNVKFTYSFCAVLLFSMLLPPLLHGPC